MERRWLGMMILAALAVATPAAAQDDESDAIDDIPHLTIVGTAHAEAKPDVAILGVAVVSERPTAVEATDAAGAASSAVVAEAKARGIADTDLQTDGLGLVQTFDDTRDANNHVVRKPRGYEATNRLTVRIHDLGKIGALVQALADKGANRFEGLSFSVSDPGPLRDRLAGEAAHNARKRAEIVAAAAGVKLGRVLLVERPEAGKPIAFQATRLAAPMAIEPGVSALDEQIEITWAIAP